MRRDWTEFTIPGTGRKVTTSRSFSNDREALLKLDGPFINYTLIIRRDQNPQLLNDKTGSLQELKANADGSYGFKSSTDDKHFILFETKTHDGISVTLSESGEEKHVFNFHRGRVSMDKENIHSILKSPRKLRIGKAYGIGVFAREDIAIDEVVEEAAVLSQQDRFLTDYTFGRDGRHIIALGYGSLYNHSDDPNLAHSINKEGTIITFTARKEIKEDEQCTISYGDQYFPSRKIVPEPI